jgi:heme O synthase-like polyprenyltransferase
VGALVFGLVYLGFAFGFARSRSNPGARRLMLASLVYFPALLLVMLLDRVVS